MSILTFGQKHLYFPKDDVPKAGAVEEVPNPDAIVEAPNPEVIVEVPNPEVAAPNPVEGAPKAGAEVVVVPNPPKPVPNELGLEVAPKADPPKALEVGVVPKPPKAIFVTGNRTSYIFFIFFYKF